MPGNAHLNKNVYVGRLNGPFLRLEQIMYGPLHSSTLYKTCPYNFNATDVTILCLEHT